MSATQKYIECFWDSQKLEKKTSNNIEIVFIYDRKAGLEVDSIKNNTGSNNPLAFSLGKETIEKVQLCYPRLTGRFSA